MKQNPIITAWEKEFKQWYDAKVEHVPRDFRCGFPLSRAGMLRNWRDDGSIFDNQLELSIRLSSTDGKTEDEINGKLYCTRTPNVIVKVPGVHYSLSFNAPRDSFFFRYLPELKEKMQEAGMLNPPWVWGFDCTPELLSLLRQTRETMQNLLEYGNVDRLDLLAMQIWQHLLQQRQQQKDTGNIENKLNRIVTYLHLHYRENIDYDRLAAENGLSRSSFFRHWRKSYQVSPARYVLELKLNEAAHLLKDSSCKIWEIASMLNFEHTEYFCNVFRKMFHLTPRQYRERGGTR